jgi:hypothetical protein
MAPTRISSQATMAVARERYVLTLPQRDRRTSPSLHATGRTDPHTARLAHLRAETDRLASELRALGPRLLEARRYAAHPACNPTLARVALDRLRIQHSRLLASIRANRLEIETANARRA